MMNSRLKPIIIIFILFSSLVNAQNHYKVLYGKVISDSIGITDVHIQNLSNKKATITDADGFFKLKVSVNDTLLFSAIHLERKKVIITSEIIKSSQIIIKMVAYTNKLDEVVLRPYNLTGSLSRDMMGLKTESVITTSTLGLPNANFQKLTQSENKLNDADHGKLIYYYGIAAVININKLLNKLSGRTKMLKERVALDKKYEETKGVEKSILNSLFVEELKIPTEKIYDFIYYCELDSNFQVLANGVDELKLWEFLKKMSLVYKQQNGLE